MWDTETLGNIMKACVIMHNMIIEDEEAVDPNERFEYGGQNVEPSHESNRTIDEFIDAHKRIRSSTCGSIFRTNISSIHWSMHCSCTEALFYF